MPFPRPPFVKGKHHLSKHGKVAKRDEYLNPSSSALKSISRSSSVSHSVSSLHRKKKPPHHLQNTNSKDSTSVFSVTNSDLTKRRRTGRSKTPHRSSSSGSSRGSRSLRAHAANSKKAATVMRVPKPPHPKLVDAGSKKFSMRTSSTNARVHSRNHFVASVAGAGTGCALRRHHSPRLSHEGAVSKLKSWFQHRLLLSIIQTQGCFARRVGIEIDYEERLANIRQRWARRVVRRFLVKYVVKRISLRRATSSRGVDEGALLSITNVNEVQPQNLLSAGNSVVAPVYQKSLRYRLAVMRIEKAWMRSRAYCTQTRRLQLQRLLGKSESIERLDSVRLHLSSIIKAYQIFYNNPIILASGAARRSFLLNQTSLFDSTDVSKSKDISINEDKALALANSSCSSSIQSLLRYLCEADDEFAQGELPPEDDIIRQISRRFLFSKEEWKLLMEIGKKKLEDMLREATMLRNAQDEAIGYNCLNADTDSYSCAANPKEVSHSPTMKTHALSSTICAVPYFLTQHRFLESGFSSKNYDSAGHGAQPSKPLAEQDHSCCVFTDGFILHPSTVKRSPLFHEYEVARKIDREHCEPAGVTPIDDSLVIGGYSSRMAEFFLEPAMPPQECHPHLQSQAMFPTSSTILGDLWSDFLHTSHVKNGCGIANSETRRSAGSGKALLCAGPHGEERSREGKGREGEWGHSRRNEAVWRRRCEIPHHLLFQGDDAVAAPEGSGFFIEDCIDSFKKETHDCANRPSSRDGMYSFSKSQADTRKSNSSIKSAC